MHKQSHTKTDLLDRFTIIPTRIVKPNSLLGLLFHLKTQAKNVDARIKGVEKRLREMGVSETLGTHLDVLEVLAKRRDGDLSARRAAA